MRVVFLGATTLGFAACSAIIEDGLADVVGIATIPRKFEISYSTTGVTNVLYSDFHALGATHGIPVIEVTGRMGSYREQIAALKPDFILVIGWYYMIPASIRSIAPLGCAGVHASLLPKYRGGAPLVWAMINGESITGVTLFYFDDGVDTGDVIAQQTVSIEEADTIREVLAKAETATLELVRRWLPRIADGSAPRTPQDHDAATVVPQRSPADGRIDWSWEPERIRNFIRAQTRPYPGAFTVIDGKRVTIWDASVELNNGESKSDHE